MDLKDVIVVPLYISGGIKDFSIIDLKNLLLCVYIYIIDFIICCEDFIVYMILLQYSWMYI